MLKFFITTCCMLTLTTAYYTVDSQEDLKMMTGSWVIEKAELGGNPFPEEISKKIKLTIEGDNYIVATGDAIDKGKCKLDPSVNPKTIVIEGIEGPNKGKTLKAIYEIKDKSLVVCYDITGKEFPKEFKSQPNTLQLLIHYVRPSATKQADGF